MYSVSRVLLILSVLFVFGGIAVLALTIPQAALLLVVLCLCIAVRRRGYGKLTSHGTARFADDDDLQGMIGAKDGLIIGHPLVDPPTKLRALRRLFNPRVSAPPACRAFIAAVHRRRPTYDLVRLPEAVHIAAFAPPGAGKSTGLAIPFLWTCRDSMVVVDTKGELAKIAMARRREIGHRVVLLDPYHLVTEESDAFNQLDWISKDDPTALDLCRDLAEALVIRDPEEREKHWSDSSEMFIASLIALTIVYAEPDDRSLQTVKALLSHPLKLQKAIEVMCASDAWQGLLARLGGQMSHFKDKELNSVVTTSLRSLLNNPVEIGLYESRV